MCLLAILGSAIESETLTKLRNGLTFKKRSSYQLENLTVMVTHVQKECLNSRAAVKLMINILRKKKRKRVHEVVETNANETDLPISI